MKKKKKKKKKLMKIKLNSKIINKLIHIIFFQI